MLSTPAPELWRAAGARPVLRIAVVGAGRWGVNLIRAFQATPAAHLAAVCDTSPERLNAVDGGFEKLSDFRSVLECSAVDVVAIATPPGSHSALAAQSLEAGKHVFVEKPMAVDLAGALAVRAAAARSGLRIMVGYVLQHHWAVSTLFAAVGSRLLGTPLAVLAHRGGGRLPGPAHPPWWSLAPHDVSLANLLFESAARQVVATEDPETREQLATISYACGRRATLRIEPRAEARQRRFIVIGTHGSAVFDDLEPLHKLKFYSLQLDPKVGLATADAALRSHAFDVPQATQDEPLRRELAHFVESVQDDTPFRTGIDHAVDVVSALAAGETSLLSNGIPVTVKDWRQGALQVQDGPSVSSSWRP
ncbi:MAG TPA: Gfo/Idh/MocA family oxidoreductase [Polyangiaceae bacterium]|nr:Gfo/Idh/MocA family oxidoreductase [Polyangiaceae bacterium]